METKVDDKRMKSIRRKLGYANGFDVSADGSKCGLCLAWKEEVIVSFKVSLLVILILSSRCLSRV